MWDDEELAREFQALRGRLLGVAYGLLGSVDEAEDVVQESWLRLRSADRARIEDLTGWLIVTTARLARDVLRSARYRREEYVGPWLPEPLVTGGRPRPDPAGGGDPADRVTLDESLSMALLVVLESLTPAERTAFVLHDVFGIGFPEIGEVVGRGPAACRQLAVRARRRIEARAPRFEAPPDEQRRVLAAFAAACRTGDVQALLALLDPDVVVRSDGGGRVAAARRPVHGADRVARYLLGVARWYAGDGGITHATVNGRPGLLWARDGHLQGVMSLTLDGGRIVSVDFVRNPDKLERARHLRGTH
ncbi:MULTISPECIES: RNA polymerase sigma factor SigJ [Actinomadura]|uniref:RNA polymerase sigma factor SigJ n=1 Tax=Actinomadura litoris TaxID=2678616 RepID=A0A7K1L8U5_9ACTN|nr:MULTISPECIES: RNA polymerase sigma factor SigJ [Actinomadura]MUN40636.1 RNA polymerase sigma factor SigJ [Actinomadura litoris]